MLQRESGHDDEGGISVHLEVTLLRSVYANVRTFPSTLMDRVCTSNSANGLLPPGSSSFETLQIKEDGTRGCAGHAGMRERNV